VNPRAITFNDSICDLGSAGYSGSGTAADPWRIIDSDSLWEVTDCEAQNPGSFYALLSDIDASGSVAAPVTKPIGFSGVGNVNYFKGSLDGNGFAILGVNLVGAPNQGQTSGKSSVGLFAALENAQIRDLSISVIALGATLPTAESRNSEYSTGGLAGFSKGSLTLENISARVAIYGVARAGGLIGQAESVTATGISVSGSVSGDWNVGGLFGEVRNSAIISGSLNSANVSAAMSGNYSATGGFIGVSAGSLSIQNSVNSGSVTSKSAPGSFVGLPFLSSLTGGFVGSAASASFSNLVNFGKVKVSTDVANSFGVSGGGLIGGAQAIDIQQSSNQGSVAVWGNLAGGLIAEGGRVTIRESMNSAEVAASSNVAAGLVSRADHLIVNDSVNSGKIVAPHGIGGLAASAAQSALIVNSLNVGELTLLTSPTSSAALREVGNVLNSSPVPNAAVDGLLATGVRTAVHSFTLAPSMRSSVSTLNELTSRGTYLSWNFDSVWGFDCSETTRLPKLRSLTSNGITLRSGCDVVPAATAPAPTAPVSLVPVALGSYIVSISGNLTINGSNLNLVTRVLIGTHSAVIAGFSNGVLSLNLPTGLTAGLYDLTLESAQGNSTLARSLLIQAAPASTSSSSAQPTDSPPIPTTTSPPVEPTKSSIIGQTKSIGNFAANQVAISGQQRQQLVELFVESEATRLFCTAVTHQDMILRVRLALRSQARSVCNAVAQSVPGAATWVQSKATIHKQMAGRVLVTFKE
jgi:hypothetical protein